MSISNHDEPFVLFCDGDGVSQPITENDVAHTDACASDPFGAVWQSLPQRMREKNQVESKTLYLVATPIGNLDDMTPEAIGFALERLLEAGALDAWTTPIGMKKSRPGVLLRALCRPEKRQAVLDVFLRDTTTLGVREHRCSRTALQRSVSEADSPWGPVRCKQAGGYGVSRKKYEFDDLARIARETGLSLPELLEKLP